MPRQSPKFQLFIKMYNTHKNAYTSKANVGKNSNAIFQSFMRKRINNTYAIARTTAMQHNAKTKFLSVKNAKTKRIEKMPSKRKNIIDGNKCLNSTSLDTANTHDR